jgi:cold shock CspA family protein
MTIYPLIDQGERILVNKNFNSSPVVNYGAFNKTGNQYDNNMTGMPSNFLLGPSNNSNQYKAPPPGIYGMGMTGGYQNMPMSGQLMPNMMPNDGQSYMPSLSRQFNNLNISEQNQYLQNKMPVGAPMPLNNNGLTQEQVRLLISLQGQMAGHNVASKALEQSFGGPQQVYQGVAMQNSIQNAPVPKMLQSYPPAPIPNITSTSDIYEMTKIFLSSMRDLSGKGKTTGILKFFNEGKGFGFFVSDADGKDVFFHYEDVKELKITKDFLREAKNKFIVKFAFTVQVYYGKYNYSTKAVDIELLGIVDTRFLPQSDIPSTN